MSKILKVNYPDRLTSAALYECHAYWDDGRLLVGGLGYEWIKVSNPFVDIQTRSY